VKKHSSSRTKKKKRKEKRSLNYIVPIHNALGCECIITVIIKPTTLSFYFIFVIHLHILVLINLIVIVHHNGHITNYIEAVFVFVV